jgi:glycerol-3-phosphate dehydrogenase
MTTRDALLLMDNRLGRVIFLIPWYGRTLLGTTDTDYAGSPDNVTVEHTDIRYLLEQANRALQVPWQESDIIGSFAGLRVLQGGSGGSPSSETRECRMSESSPNLFTPVGGKMSSARLDAAHLVTTVMERLGRDEACSTGERPFPWSPGEMGETGSHEMAVLCRERYGSRMSRLHEILQGSPDLARPIVPGLPFYRGEIVHAVRHEMARTLQDVFRRRIPLILLTPLPAEIVWDAARLAGDILGWSEERRAREAGSILAGATARLLPT